MENICEELSASLPAVSDEEPPSLRQDICDELNDHLQCLIRGEQCRTGNDRQTVWKRVVSRFGDPGQVARTLYWQAMWSRVMQQRALMAVSASMLIIGMLMVGLMWTMLQRQQDLLERQLTTAEKHQSTLEAIVNQIGRPVSPLGTLRVHADRPISARLNGGALQNSIDFDLDSSEGPKDIDFGELPPGIYFLTVASRQEWMHTERIVLHTGEARVEDFSVPLTIPAEIKLVSNLPEPYSRCIQVAVSAEEVVIQQDRRWRRPRDSAWVSVFRKQMSMELMLSGQYWLKYSLNPDDDDIEIELLNSSDSPPMKKGEQAYCAKVQIEPGLNTLHLEIPDRWIKTLKENAEALLQNVPVEQIRSTVLKMLEQQSRNRAAKLTGHREPNGRQVVLFAAVSSSSGSHYDYIQGAITQSVQSVMEGSEDYQLAVSDAVLRTFDAFNDTNDEKEQLRFLSRLDLENQAADYVLLARMDFSYSEHPRINHAGVQFMLVEVSTGKPVAKSSFLKFEY